MILDLSIQIRSEDLDYVRRELKDLPLKQPKVMAAALNNSIEFAQSYIARRLKTVSEIKDKNRLIKDIKLVKANYTNLSAGVSFYGRAIGAIQFKHTVYKTTGVRWKVDKGGSFLRRSDGFEGIGLSGQRGEGAGNAHLWIRRDTIYRVGSRAHYKPNIGRVMHQIRPIYGPKLTTIWQRHPEIKAEVTKRVGQRLNARILSQVDRALNRKKADRPADAPELVFPDEAN